MEKLARKAVLIFAVVVPALVATNAFAQAGGNGQGGTGGGNAHGAATAGMTYRGDPIDSPLDKMAKKSSDNMTMPDNGMHPMPPDNGANPPKTVQ